MKKSLFLVLALLLFFSVVGNSQAGPICLYENYVCSQFIPALGELVFGFDFLDTSNTTTSSLALCTDIVGFPDPWDYLASVIVILSDFSTTDRVLVSREAPIGTGWYNLDFFYGDSTDPFNCGR